MNFSNLKKKSNTFDRLLKEVDKIQNPVYESSETDNYWKLTPDKAGNALAVIRFLPEPAVDGDDALPWVRYWDHGFQNKQTGKWYIEKSRTTLDGQKDPVSEYNSELWGDQANRDPNYRVEERKQVREQKRRLHYVSNIYVISDPKNPQNEGKIFLFKYGKKIFDKITKAMNPDLESEAKINPFDLWTGAPFKLKMTRQSGFPNYDESVFLTPGPLSNDDAELENIWKTEYSLKEIVDPKNFKSYEQLKSRLYDVIGLKAGSAAPKSYVEEDVEEDVPFTDYKTVAAPKTVTSAVVEEEEDDDLAMFRRLAND